MSSPLIQFRGVCRTFGGDGESAVHALSDVNLSIYRGEFVAIVGPSGGGKTTLLSVIGLLDAPTLGTYQFDGVDTGTLNDRELTMLRSRVFGFVFQSFHLLGRRPVRDSAELGLFYQGVRPEARHTAARKALERLGLGEKEQALACLLSGGQQQRVAIARAAAAGSAVILADEPTGNLDRETGLRVLDELTDLHRSGTTVVVVTHSEEVAARAQRVIRIIDGRIVADSENAKQSTGQSVDSDLPHRGELAPQQRILLRDLAGDALSSLLSRRRHSTGLVLAVTVAVAMMVLTIGLGASARAQVSDVFDAARNREVTVGWQNDGNETHQPDIATAVERAKELAGVKSVAGIGDYGDASVIAAGGTADVTIKGVTGDFAGASESSIRWANRNVGSLSPGTALIGGSLAQQLQLAPLAASPTVEINGAPFSIIGIIKESQRYPLLAGEIITSDADAAKIATMRNSTIAITTMNGAAPQVGKQVSAAINPFDPDSVLVQVPVDVLTLRQQVEGGVQTTLTAFTILAALVAIVTLANAITLSVLARRGEFGLRRAVGAQGRQLASLVSLEAAAVGVVGGIAGLVLGVLTLLGFTIAQRWIPVFNLALAPAALGAGVLLAVTSSIIGASRAAKLSPAAALHD